jgi:hypothetical protein
MNQFSCLPEKAFNEISISSLSKMPITFYDFTRFTQRPSLAFQDLSKISRGIHDSLSNCKLGLIQRHAIRMVPILTHKASLCASKVASSRLFMTEHRLLFDWSRQFHPPRFRPP